MAPRSVSVCLACELCIHIVRMYTQMRAELQHISIYIRHTLRRVPPPPATAPSTPPLSRTHIALHHKTHNSFIMHHKIPAELIQHTQINKWLRPRLPRIRLYRILFASDVYM